ncbi:MAG: hypothetical protein ACYSYU_10975 [Planctomycetota bacterium]|jgi:hypothetical protein
MQRRDHKEVFSEAYYNAIDDGLPQDQAEKKAEEAVQDYVERLVNEADNLRKELREK